MRRTVRALGDLSIRQATLVVDLWPASWSHSTRRSPPRWAPAPGPPTPSGTSHRDAPCHPRGFPNPHARGRGCDRRGHRQPRSEQEGCGFAVPSWVAPRLASLMVVSASAIDHASSVVLGVRRMGSSRSRRRAQERWSRPRCSGGSASSSWRRRRWSRVRAPRPSDDGSPRVAQGRTRRMGRPFLRLKRRMNHTASLLRRRGADAGRAGRTRCGASHRTDVSPPAGRWAPAGDRDRDRHADARNVGVTPVLLGSPSEVPRWHCSPPGTPG